MTNRVLSRKKLNAYLRELGVTHAGFSRDIAETCGRNIQSKMRNDFLTKRGH